MGDNQIGASGAYMGFGRRHDERKSWQRWRHHCVRNQPDVSEIGPLTVALNYHQAEEDITDYELKNWDSRRFVRLRRGQAGRHVWQPPS